MRYDYMLAGAVGLLVGQSIGRLIAAVRKFMRNRRATPAPDLQTESLPAPDDGWRREDGSRVCGFSWNPDWWCQRDPHAEGPCAIPYAKGMYPVSAQRERFTDESPFNGEAP